MKLYKDLEMKHECEHEDKIAVCLGEPLKGEYPIPLIQENPYLRPTCEKFGPHSNMIIKGDEWISTRDAQK